MLPTSPSTSDADRIAVYKRQFHSLSVVAEQLGIPASEAEQLIHKVLLLSLTRRPGGDVDAWLVAALTSAARARKESA
jgi:hypothetical protein